MTSSLSHALKMEEYTDDPKLKNWTRNRWDAFDTYVPEPSWQKVVTRSQTGFNRVYKSLSNVDVFSHVDQCRIPNRHDIMTHMTGRFGSVMRTIVTRSTGKNLSITRDLELGLRAYKEMLQLVRDTSKRNEVKLRQDLKPRLHTHDTYDPGVSFKRVTTRSQTGFNRVRKTESAIVLFSDKNKHTAPFHPHLLNYMEGRFGSAPRTIITRSTGKYLSITQDLDDGLFIYKEQPSIAEDAMIAFEVPEEKSLGVKPSKQKTPRKKSPNKKIRGRKSFKN